MSETSDVLWPALTYETLPWDLGPTPMASRSAIRSHRGTYRAAIPPAIAECDFALSSEAAAAMEDASNEISRFDAELGAEIAPFSAILLRSESAASSKIEKLTASARRIGEAELLRDPNTLGSGPPHRFALSNASLIVANARSMQAAIALAETIDEHTILSMHRELLESSAPRIAGKWRTNQVWIGGSNLGPHKAMFVPPQAGHLVDSIADLLRYIARDDVPVLVHAAIAHAQFETIHPFPDGNGRTGRALLHAHLRNKRLTRNVTVPISAGLLTDTSAYFAALTEYRAGNPSPIIDKIGEAAFAAVANGRLLVGELRSIRNDWGVTLRARNGSNARKISELLLQQPVVNAQVIASHLGISLPNVYRALRPLVDVGVLLESTDQRRNQIWRAPQVLQALDDFAIRAGRRSKP